MFFFLTFLGHFDADIHAFRMTKLRMLGISWAVTILLPPLHPGYAEGYPKRTCHIICIYHKYTYNDVCIYRPVCVYIYILDPHPRAAAVSTTDPHKKKHTGNETLSACSVNEYRLVLYGLFQLAPFP